MDFSVVNEGKYPHKQMFRSKKEKVAFSVMICYSLVIYFQIAIYYVYGGH